MILNRIDTFFSTNQLTKLNEMAQSGWGFQVSDSNSPFGMSFLYLDLDESFVEEEVKPLLKNKLPEEFKNFRIDRAYLNGQWNGRDGNFHQDATNDKAFTVLVYLNQEYDFEWGGFTQFISDDKQTSLVETPVFNRALIFRGNNWHKSYAFCYQSCPMRVTLAIKLTQL